MVVDLPVTVGLIPPVQNRTLTLKQRAKIEQQLERDHQFLECAQSEYGKKDPAFSEVVSEIEAVLRDLAEIYVAAKH